MKRLAILVVCWGTWVSSATADAPVAQYLFPAGGQRGSTVKFHVGGLYLNRSCTMEMIGPGVQASTTLTRTTSPWFEGSLLPIPESQRQEDYPRAMAASVTIAADATGDRLVYLRTAQGITTPLKFVLGTYPEIVEDEQDGDPEPVAVQAPTTVNGRIFPREDRDIWSVNLKRGQILSCLVDADRIGSPLEAKLEVRDAAGPLLAEVLPKAGRDPRLTFTAPHDGRFHVHITDVRAEGGPAFVYRLTLTTEETIERVFPLGGQRGQKLAVEASGSHGSRPLTLDIPRTGRPAWSFPFDIDDLPELRERDTPDPIRGAFLNGPCVANGRIAVAGEVDRWSFSAKKGEALSFELRAAQFGSPLLGVLRICDASGKELAKAEPGPTLDPTLLFTAPADGLYEITVQDRFRSRGSAAHAYRLRLTRPANGFELNFTLPTVTVTRDTRTAFRVQIKRHGSFSGPIQLRAEGLPKGVSVPANLVVQPNQATFDIPFHAEKEAPIAMGTITVHGSALMPLTPFTAMPAWHSRTATWVDDPTTQQVRLAVAVATPFKIVGDYELKLIPRGTVHTRKYRIERNGYEGPIEVDLADRQARHLQGVTGPVFTIPPNLSEFDYPITLPPWMETGRTCRVCVMGTATVRDVDGKDHVVTYSSREQNDQIIAVVEPERLGLIVDQQTIRVQAGQQATLPFIVRRGNGMKGQAIVSVVLPEATKGVTVPAVAVDEKAEAGKLTFAFAADKPLATRTVVTVRAVVLENGRPVTAEKTVELLPAR